MKTKTLFFSSLVAAAAMSTVPAWAEDKTITSNTTISDGDTYDTVSVKSGATVTQDSGTATFKRLLIHTAKDNNSETYNLNGGVLNITGGDKTASGSIGENNAGLIIGHWGNNGSSISTLAVAKDAVLNAVSGWTFLSWDTSSVLNINGEVNLYGITFSKGTNYKPTATLTLADGGRLNLGAGGFANENSNAGADNVNLNGGTLGALDSWSATVAMTVNGNVKIDTTKWVSSDSGTGTSATGANTGATITLSGNITQTAGTLTVSGAGTLALSGASTLNGSVTVDSGATLDLSGGTLTLASAISNSGTVVVNSNTVFVLADSLKTSDTDSGTIYTLITNTDGGSITDWNTLSLSNFRQADGTAFGGRTTAVVDTDGAVTITGVAFNLFWKGGSSGTWDTTESNTIWGKDSASGADTAFVAGDNVTFDSGESVSVTVASSGVTAKTMTVSAGTVTLSGGKVTTTNGITVKDTGTLKISSNSNIGGNVTVGTGGTFDLNGQSNSISESSTGFGTLTLAGGKLTNTGANVDTIARQLYALTVTADSEIGGTGNFGLVGNQYAGTTLNLGTNTLTKTGDNTLWLVNTTVNGTGTIKVSGGSIADDASTRTLTLGNASIVLDGGSANFSGTVIAGASTLNGGNVDGTQISIGTLNFGYGSGAQTLNISGNVSVTGNFQEASSGVDNGETITLSDGANLSVGGTFGTTTANASDWGQHTYKLNVGSGASFSAGTIAHGDGLTVSIGNGNASVSATTLVLNSVWGNKTHYFTGQGADVSTLSIGTVNLNNTSGKTTTLSVSNARFEVGAGGITGNSSTPVSLNGVTLGVRDGADSWSSSLAMTLAGAMGADVASGKSITLDGVLSGTTTGFTKTGDGTLTLGGANTFTGGVNINAGTLVAANAKALGAGAVSVESGAKLGLVANVTVSGVTGGITLAEGAKIVIDMTDVDVSETETFTLDLITGTELTYNSTTITGENVNTMLKNVIEFSNWDESLTEWTLTFDDSDSSKKLSLSLTKIPEPSAFGLLAGVGALVFVAARRRRRAK